MLTAVEGDVLVPVKDVLFENLEVDTGSMREICDCDEAGHVTQLYGDSGGASFGVGGCDRPDY